MMNCIEDVKDEAVGSNAGLFSDTLEDGDAGKRPSMSGCVIILFDEQLKAVVSSGVFPAAIERSVFPREKAKCRDASRL